MDIPKNALAFIATDSGLDYLDGDYEAQFEIDVDSLTGDSNIDRWVNVYQDATATGTDTTMRLSVLKAVPPGTHTFRLLAARYQGSGTVYLYDPTLTVMTVSLPLRVYLPLISR